MRISKWKSDWLKPWKLIEGSQAIYQKVTWRLETKRVADNAMLVTVLTISTSSSIFLHKRRAATIKRCHQHQISVINIKLTTYWCHHHCYPNWWYKNSRDFLNFPRRKRKKNLITPKFRSPLSQLEFLGPQKNFEPAFMLNFAVSFIEKTMFWILLWSFIEELYILRDLRESIFGKLFLEVGQKFKKLNKEMFRSVLNQFERRFSYNTIR